MSAVLSVRDLSVDFHTSRGVVHAVESLSFDLEEGQTLAIVGESGSGKSTAALALLRLIPSPPGRIVGGQVRFEDRDLLALSGSEIRRVRGRKISMIFQDPTMALNPVYTVERQIGEVLRLHLGLSRQEIFERVVELLRLVGVPAPEQRARQYPHNLSGGMRQRVMIAMALACRPRILIADEPTTALDVTIQAQVLELIQDLKDRIGMSVILITHDLGVVAETAHRVVVMYGGRKVEEGDARAIFRDPHHPYTQGLLRSARWQDAEGDFLPEIPGHVPSPFAMPPGCSFAPRCPLVRAQCNEARPELEELAPGRPVACFVAREQPG